MRKPKLTANKLVSMKEAIADSVKPGCNLYIEGFTHLISFAAGHEIIRQQIKDITAIRLTPDLVYDQLIEAGLVKKLVFSWAGNPGVGSLHALRRVSQKDWANSGRPKIELEEYSHFGMVARLLAGSSGLPFWPLKNYQGTHIAESNPKIKSVDCPYTGETFATVPALHPDPALPQRVVPVDRPRRQLVVELPRVTPRPPGHRNDRRGQPPRRTRSAACVHPPT